MGDMADLMLEGHICEVCGVEMEECNNFPTRCEACSEEEDDEQRVEDFKPV